VLNLPLVGACRSEVLKVMTLTQKGVKVVAGRMPKMITPRAHAALDYAIAGSFFLMGALFWKRNRRAGMGSLLCGGATAAVSVLTDYPGGVKKIIPYPLRKQIDTGLVAMAAAMPRLLDVEDKRDAKFFSRQALARTAITAMANFDHGDGRRTRRER
ncbi:MAG TPA: hypothetical protein VF772_02890, partial [Terriglobales bacterium]